MKRQFLKTFVKFCGVLPEEAGDALKALVRGDVNVHELREKLGQATYQVAGALPPQYGVPLAAANAGLGVVVDTAKNIKDGESPLQAAKKAMTDKNRIQQAGYAAVQSAVPLGDSTTSALLANATPDEIKTPPKTGAPKPSKKQR